MLGGWKPQATQLLHEVLLTGELIRFPFVHVNRGKFVDSLILPDATLFIGPHLSPVHVELDRSTEGYTAVKSRIYKAYRSCPEPVIWIAPTKTRMDGIRRHANPIADRAFFKVIGSDVLYDFEGSEYLAEFFSTEPTPEPATAQGV